jgi:hypothetical protein
MRRAALPLLIVACVVVAAVLAWLVLQRAFRPATVTTVGPAVAEVLAPGPFRRIAVNGLASVEIVQGDRHEVRIEGPAGSVRARVDDGTLTIANRGGKVELPLFGGESQVRPRVVVTAPAIDAIAADGAVQIVARRLETPSLRIAASGATKIRIDDLEAETLRLSGAGAVHVEIGGRVRDQSISLSGAGDYRGARLESESAKISVAGAGRVVVNAAKSLNASLSGAGSVEYLGDPEVKQSVSGIGSIKRREKSAAAARARFRPAAPA